MNSLVLAAALLLQLPPTANTQAPASIEGIVVDKQMQPVAGAEVSAFWEPPPMAYQPDQVPRGYTDSAGKFVIPNITPGGFRLWVSASGYVPQTYGAKAAGGLSTGTVISLAPGQSVRGITVLLTAASTISGRVTSSTGELLSGLNVNAVRIAYDSSGIKKFITTNGAAQTDDRGEYRITGIAPGRYYLRAESPGSSIPNELLQRIGRAPISSGAYGAMYYPGVADASGASLLELRERESVQGINFVLPRLPTFKIRGHVLDASGLPPNRPMLGVTPIVADFFSGASMSVSPYCGTTPICENTDGAFEMAGSAPGNYWVTAQISVPLTPEQRTLLETPGADPALLPQPQRAVAAVRVTNSDVAGVELRFYPKLTMTGRVLIDDSTLPATPGDVTIKVGFRQSYSGGLGPATIVALDAAGRFSSGNLLPGEYRVEVHDLPPGVFMIDARLGDRDVSTDFIRILAPQSDELNIRLSAKS